MIRTGAAQPATGHHDDADTYARIPPTSWHRLSRRSRPRLVVTDLIPTGTDRCARHPHDPLDWAGIGIGEAQQVSSANQVLALRVLRVNGWWDEYWDQTYGPRAAA